MHTHATTSTSTGRAAATRPRGQIVSNTRGRATALLATGACLCLVGAGCAAQTAARSEPAASAEHQLVYDHLIEDARTQLARGDAQRACGLATRAAELFPERAAAFRVWAAALAAQGHHQESAETYERARALGGLDQGLALELADLYERSDAPDRAGAVLRSYHKEHRDDALVTRRLAQFWLRHKAFEQAADVLREALLRDPDDIELLHSMGKALLGSGHPRDAAASYERAVLIDPARADTLRLLAEAHEAAGARDKALVAVDRALRLSGHDGETLRQRGRLRALEGDWKGAMSDYAEFAELSADPERAWRDLEGIARNIDDERLLQAAAQARAAAEDVSAKARQRISKRDEQGSGPSQTSD